jgi:hypothetical protein
LCPRRLRFRAPPVGAWGLAGLGAFVRADGRDGKLIHLPPGGDAKRAFPGPAGDDLFLSFGDPEGLDGPAAGAEVDQMLLADLGGRLLSEEWGHTYTLDNVKCVGVTPRTLDPANALEWSPE